MHFNHRKWPCLDMKLTPAACNFFHSAGVLQSKEPRVSKALSPSTVASTELHPKQTTVLPSEQWCQQKCKISSESSYLHQPLSKVNLTQLSSQVVLSMMLYNKQRLVLHFSVLKGGSILVLLDNGLNYYFKHYQCMIQCGFVNIKSCT